MLNCRACGQSLAGTDGCESFENYRIIYCYLTSIEITDNGLQNNPKVCSCCVDKLLEFDRFRQICLEVHENLIHLKNEPTDFLKTELVTIKTEDFIIESLDNDDEYAVNSEADDDDEEDEEDEDDKPLASMVSNDQKAVDTDNNITPKLKKPRAKYGSQKNKKVKEPIPLYQCELCPKTFRVLWRYEGHKRTHAGLKPFACDLCEKSFNKWFNYKMHHKQYHTEDKIRLPCDHPGCELIFTTKLGLQRHQQRMHDPNFKPPEPTPFVCDICGKTFSSNGTLKKHKYIHTPNEMPFMCGQCDKKFTTKYKLKEHTMRHQGVKNHTCPFCGARKTTGHELKMHINQVHAKQRNYSCDHCSTSFGQLSNLNRHVKIVHLGLKPYACQICERAFGKNDHLKRHMKSHDIPKSGAPKGQKRFLHLLAEAAEIPTDTF
ncbi:oocyte zinc finger protein XlCOF6.1-like [Uranotaenia lowii]|uniref:oocyte zinc finger protein XlCOF6.1-like n=1 Tax=Uranotaenia lowii TaxID=190385 RepID=UPI00247925DC|nr:oocyte zinc finger protein XlCOF6.1-like [Uranotaenia lowii]